MVCLNLSVLDLGWHRESIRGAWGGGGATPSPKKHITIKKFSKNFAKCEIKKFSNNFAICEILQLTISKIQHFEKCKMHNFNILKNAKWPISKFNAICKFSQFWNFTISKICKISLSRKMQNFSKWKSSKLDLSYIDQFQIPMIDR